VRLRWHDGERIVEELRTLEQRGGSGVLFGPPLGSDRLRRADRGDTLLLTFDPVHDIAGGTRWLVTMDAWIEGECDAEVRAALHAALGHKRQVALEGEQARALLILARRQLPAFGGGRAWEVEGLSDREWSALRRWLAEHVRMSKLRELLLAASGSDVATILDLLAPRKTHRPTRRDLAEAVIRRYGIELLADRKRRRILITERFRRSKRRPRNPDAWSRGSHAAHRLVHRLGLPRAMAGQASAPTPPFEELPALPPLGQLHDYQQQLADGMRSVLHADDWRERRAIVWLPTGTGKTRTCVETLLMELSLGPPRNTLLWIADREELCEQAIDSFRHVWLLRGHETPCARNTQAGTLRVVRAWGRRSPPEVPVTPTLVVASIQTLASRVRELAGERWLAAIGERCAAVVFDEAHHVVAPSYAHVIRALGLTNRKNVLGHTRRDGAPLLGLTATPGRRSQDETERLAKRFRGRLLEPGAPYRDIEGYIRRGYLSRPRLEVVPTGYQLDRLSHEAEHWARTRMLHPDTLARAGRDPARTAVILRDLEPRLDELRSVLVFACSVEHAETIAEVLSRRGHRAVALHGASPHAARQAAIRRFREGTLPVLVSCDLLTTGFDAPNVDAVVLARPVESRILFAQMIGRGLRGPKNGGTERCLILDYEDASGPYRDLDRLRVELRRAFVEVREE